LSKAKNTKIWATLVRRHKIVKEILFPCTLEDALDGGLREVCKAFDVSFPIVLQKHKRELLEFARTGFTESDFLEPFPYSALSLELFSEEPKDPPRIHIV